MFEKEIYAVIWSVIKIAFRFLNVSIQAKSLRDWSKLISKSMLFLVEGLGELICFTPIIYKWHSLKTILITQVFI